MAVAPPRVVELRAGERTTCLRADDDRAWCVGAQPLPSTTADRLAVVSDAEVCVERSQQVKCFRDAREQPREPTPFVERSAGAGVPCGRTAGGEVWCGVDARATASRALRPVPLPADAAQVVGDGQRTCARLVDGQLVCWAPYDAMTGVPRTWVQADGVEALAASWTQSCWSGPGGAVQCWGESGSPRGIVGAPPADAIAVGAQISCVRSASEAWCWTGEAPAGRVPLRGGAVAVTVGSAHGCALLTDAGVQCWGDDSHGQRTGAEAPVGVR